MTTVAQFLREKTTNMCAWLKEAGYTGNLDLPHLPDVALVALVQELHEKYATSIKERDLTALRDVPKEVADLAHFVEEHAELHDKFWRYMQLFSDTISNHE